MTKSRTNFVINNIMASMLCNTIGTILPFFVRTVTIKYLGSDYMGLNNLCTSLLYILNAADLGVANAFAYKLYKPMSEKDSEKICSLLNYFRKIYFMIGLFIFIAGLCFTPFLPHFISGNVPQGVNIYVIFFLYLVNSTISYMVFAYKSLIFTADQRKDYVDIITAITFLVLYIGQIILILKGLYYASVLMLPICTLLGNLSRNALSNRKYPLYQPNGELSYDIKHAIKDDIFSVALYKLRDISRNTFDNVVISSFAGLVILSNYQNYYTIFTVPYLFMSIVCGALIPSIGNYVTTNSESSTFNIYHKIIFIISFLSGWFAICYVFLIQDFIVLWLGNTYLLSNTAALLFAIYIWVLGDSTLIRAIREGAGLWKYGQKYAALEMVSNLILNVIFMKLFGVEGIILATIVSILLISTPAENYIVYKHYFKGKFIERLKIAVGNIVWLAITAVISGILCSFAPEASLAGFIYKTCICVVIPLLTLTIFFHQTDDFRFIVDEIKLQLKGIKQR